MVTVWLVRHGPTVWNAEGRIQGHSDAPLSDEGRRAVAGWRLPIAPPPSRWISSDLSRARETAEILARSHGFEGAIEPEPDLREMAYGDWEGRLREEFKQRMKQDGRIWRAPGRDFRPPGGESPAEMERRVAEALGRIGRSDSDSLAVVHRGVLRTLVALATGWDQTGDPPVEIRPFTAHRISLRSGGMIASAAFNLDLTDADAVIDH